MRVDKQEYLISFLDTQSSRETELWWVKLATFLDPSTHHVRNML